MFVCLLVCLFVCLFALGQPIEFIQDETKEALLAAVLDFYRQRKAISRSNIYKMQTMKTSAENKALIRGNFKKKLDSLIIGFQKQIRQPIQALIAHDYVSLATNSNFNSTHRAASRAITTVETFACESSLPFKKESSNKALEAFTQCLGKLKIEDRRINIFISECWSYPLVISLKQTQLSDAEVEVMLMGLYRKQYPELFNELELSWDRQDNQIVCLAAIKKDLDHLRNTLRGKGMSIDSVKPLSLEILAKLKTREKSYWIAVVEGMQVSLLRVENGLILEWTTLASESNLEQALSLNLMRHSSRSKDDCKTLMIFSVYTSPSKTSNLSMQTLTHANWRVTHLDINDLQKNEMTRLVESMQKINNKNASIS